MQNYKCYVQEQDHIYINKSLSMQGKKKFLVLP